MSRKITRPLHFRIGQTADSVLSALDAKRGLRLIRTQELGRTEVDDPRMKDGKRIDLRVQWRLSDKRKLILERTRGPGERGVLCYRIVEIIEKGERANDKER